MEKKAPATLEIRRLAILMVGVAMLISCSGHSRLSPSPQSALELRKEQVWQLVCMQNHSLDRSAAAITLVFNPEAATATGNAACNEYTFSVSFENRIPQTEKQDNLERHSVTFTFWGSGNLTCPESDMNTERRYLALLSKATHMKVTPYTLVIFQHGKEILRYELID